MGIVALVFALLAAAPALAQPQAATTDEAAVRAIVQSYVDARELWDPATIDALFTADADQHTSSGEWRDRAALVAGMLASSARNPGARTIRIATVRFLTPDVAIADGPYDISSSDRIRRMWTTFVLRREPDGWRIAAIRNALPAGRAAPAAPPAAFRSSRGGPSG